MLRPARRRRHRRRRRRPRPRPPPPPPRTTTTAATAAAAATAATADRDHRRRRVHDRRHRHRRQDRDHRRRRPPGPRPPPPPRTTGTTRTATSAGTAAATAGTATTAARSAAATATAALTAGTAGTAAAGPRPPGPPGPLDHRDRHGRRTAAATTTAATSAAVTAVAATAVTATALGRLRRGLVHDREIGAGVALGHDLALVDPALDADPAERGSRLVEAVVNVRAQRVQRHATVGIALGARHLGATQASGALHLDALGAGADRAGQRALHRAPERNSVLELLGDRLRDQPRVELGALDLEDVDLDLLAGDPVKVTSKLIDLRARLADHDARPRRVDVDLHLGGVLADRDVRQAGVRQTADDVLADQRVFMQVVREVALVEPVGLPVVDVAHAHRLGMNFLTH